MATPNLSPLEDAVDNFDYNAGWDACVAGQPRRVNADRYSPKDWMEGYDAALAARVEIGSSWGE